MKKKSDIFHIHKNRTYKLMKSFLLKHKIMMVKVNMVLSGNRRKNRIKLELLKRKKMFIFCVYIYIYKQNTRIRELLRL